MEFNSGFKGLIAGLSRRRLVFGSEPLHVRFVVDKATLGRVFLQVLRVFPVNFNPLIFQTHLSLNTTISRSTSGQGGERFTYKQ